MCTHPGPSRRLGGNKLTVEKGCRIQDVTWPREAPKMPNGVQWETQWA